ncbi:MAG: U32 family peptidase [Oscillospiraceae bacterium]|nr:U32 family peptidase [Oscillospiraceae bacterium]
MTELLSPAGSWEAMVAAVQNGADAVYMGFGAFNARAGAHNFTEEKLCEAVRYCHVRGVKVYVTLNILLTDRELGELARLARAASDAGVDAILVQDWGVFETVRAAAPDVPVHASTQMSIHTLSGARECAALGMERVVLARELSGREIGEICTLSGVEIETFAHGALCMCYSGQCAMSALIGGRSGNRGRCAQPCRLPYGFSSKADGHPLSLKDANLSAHLGALCEMGVSCLKIEGRLKRPEYVAAVTGIYSRLLRERRTPTAQEQTLLADAFSRDGFTDGYFLGNRGAHMFGTRPEDARAPEAYFAELRAAYEKENLRLVPLTLRCTIRAGEASELAAEDENGHLVVVHGAVPEAARNRALTAEDVSSRLCKTGGTAFAVSQCDISLDEGLSLSAAALNALRRDALGAMEEARAAVPPRGTFDVPAPARGENTDKPPHFTVSLTSAEQFSDELAALSPARILFPVEKLDALTDAQLASAPFCAVLPRIYRTGDEAQLIELLRRAKARGVDCAAVGNLGHLALAREAGMTMHGDFSLNVFNSRALEFLKRQGLSSATVSFELRCEQIRDLAKPIPCEAIVYGRLPLMVTENCIVSNNVGCGHGKTHEIVDRTGARFPVMCAFGCRSEIENSRVLFLADREEYKHIGLAYARLRFTTESAGECVRVLSEYLSPSGKTPEAYTRGLFFRGVE